MTHFQFNKSHKWYLTISIVLVLSLFISSCKNSKYDDVLANKQYDYQPLAIGNYTIFDVDSTHYNFINPSTQQTDSFHFQQMEKITDTMYDNEGRLNYRFELFRRADPTATWRIWKVWYGLTTATTFERQEDDLRFAKLIFPPTVDVHWIGNKYVPATDSNVFKLYLNWDYHYTVIGSPTTIGTNSFTECVFVSQVDEENLIDKKLGKEIYAKNVGLVYKEFLVINKQDVTSSWSNPYKANGDHVIMKVNSYGH
jgi:hypothetical protein